MQYDKCTLTKELGVKGVHSGRPGAGLERAGERFGSE